MYIKPVQYTVQNTNSFCVFAVISNDLIYYNLIELAKGAHY